jgi:hypothetical protein
MMEPVVIEDEQVIEIPEDFREYTKFRDAETNPQTEKAPAASEEAKPPSESAEEAGQTAAESETEGKAQQAEEEDEQIPVKPADDERDTRMSRRMRKLSGTIAALEARIAELSPEPDAESEVAEEVASSPEKAAPAAETLTRPMLKDFEDNEATGESAFDLYEQAKDAYYKAEQAKALTAALDAQKADLAKQASDLEAKRAKETADREWSKAASRYPDFNEVLKPEVQISQAMEAVMRMDPEAGTDLAYYMGQHPEESKKIAESTLATNDREWGIALARAGMELGKIKATLKLPASKAGPVAVPPKTPAAAIPAIKKVTTASKPPTQIRGGVAAPKFDLMDENDAADTGKWMKARNRQIAESTGKR